MQGSQPILTKRFKDATFSLAPNLHTCISLVEVYQFGQCLGWRFLPISTFFFLVSSLTFRNASHSRFRFGNPSQCLPNFFEDALFSPPQIYTFILLVEVYRFGQCLAKRFSPISTFFSLVSSRAFRDAPHLRFRCGDPNQCLPNFLKMLLLALAQIYTRVFHL